MAHKMRMRPPQPGHSQARTSTWNTRRSIAGQDRRVRGLGAAVLGAEATSAERGIARGSGSSSAGGGVGTTLDRHLAAGPRTPA
jgi:hypothetical protein